MAVQASNPNIWEVQAGGQEFKVIHGYAMNLWPAWAKNNANVQPLTDELKARLYLGVNTEDVALYFVHGVEAVGHGAQVQPLEHHLVLGQGPWNTRAISIPSAPRVSATCWSQCLPSGGDWRVTHSSERVPQDCAYSLGLSMRVLECPLS